MSNIRFTPSDTPNNSQAKILASSSSISLVLDGLMSRLIFPEAVARRTDRSVIYVDCELRDSGAAPRASAASLTSCIKEDASSADGSLIVFSRSSYTRAAATPIQDIISAERGILYRIPSLSARYGTRTDAP